MCKIVEEWHAVKDIYLLTLDSPPPKDGFKSVKIDGKVYKPLYTHNVGQNDIGVKGDGNFVGKEVEFVV